MKSIKNLLSVIVLTLFIIPNTFSQGCEDPGEGDGINIFGYIQPQYEYNMLGENGAFYDSQYKDVDKSSFFFQRARLGVLGNIPYDFDYYFMMEFSPERGMGINDAFITYNRYPFAKLSAGLFKTPFGAEQTHACHKLHTIHRSKVVNELAGPIRDTGLMLSGSLDSIAGYKVKNLLRYNLSVVNGEGRNAIDADNRKAIVGRIAVTPIEYLTIGTSYKFGKSPSAAGLEVDDEAKRLGFDFTVNYANARLSGEYISGSDIGSYTTGGGCSGEPIEIHEGSVDRSGYYVMASYKTGFELEPVIKYETYDANLDIAENIESTWTVGLSYYFNEWTRLQVNYEYNMEENYNVEVPNDAIMIQIQAIIK